MDVIINGLLLGGTYALIAMGLTLQYGVARIMNLANGENLVLACFGAWWFFTALSINPFLALLVIAPLAFALNWLIYSIILQPLVRRSKTRGQLEVNSILATFGLLFILQGLMLLVFGGGLVSYRFLNIPVELFGQTWPYAQNRIVAFFAAMVIALALWLFLSRTRFGTAIRAVAVDPVAAELVAIDVKFASAFAFALGGALTACAGALISTFISFNPSIGVLFTIKALIIVIMGGVGDVRGAALAALLLALTETAVTSLVDPGLTLAATYLLFILTLMFRPQGLFGKRTA